MLEDDDEADNDDTSTSDRDDTAPEDDDNEGNSPGDQREDEEAWVLPKVSNSATATEELGDGNSAVGGA